jgi:hypothetical protein
MSARLLIAAALLAVGAAPPASVEALGWLGGTWEMSGPDGRWTEEHWTAPRGGMMIGGSRSGEGPALKEWEFLRIAAGLDGVPVYAASPGGGAAVPFRLVEAGPVSVTFENRAHDYPQRIRYARDGQVLTATISRIDGSGARSWRYRRRGD